METSKEAPVTKPEAVRKDEEVSQKQSSVSGHNSVMAKEQPSSDKAASSVPKTKGMKGRAAIFDEMTDEEAGAYIQHVWSTDR